MAASRAPARARAPPRPERPRPVISSSRLHLLSSGDISALLRWGGLEASGGRAEQLGRLQAALESVQAREPDHDQPEAQPVRSWLVDPFSSWRFELSSGSRGVALGRRQTAAPLDAAEAQAQQQPLASQLRRLPHAVPLHVMAPFGPGQTGRRIR